MDDKLQTADYQRYKRIRKILAWVFPALILGQAVLTHFNRDEVLEVYQQAMYIIMSIVFLYQMYYMYKYRHEDDNKMKLAVGIFCIMGLLTFILTT